MKPKQTGQLANDEAARLAHGYIGTEHLLLAIAAQPGALAARVLVGHGLDSVRLRSAVVRIVHTAPCAAGVVRPYTPRAKRAIESAVAEARSLGHNYVGPEHLLLGLLQVADGVGVQAIQDLGADPAAIRRSILEGLEQV